MHYFTDMKVENTVADSCGCPSPTSSDDGDSRQPKSSLHGVIDRSKRLKASARERRRRHVLNDALENLRHKVPSVNQRPSNKLSKIEVLRMAIDYIAMLSCYLNYATPSPPPMNYATPSPPPMNYATPSPPMQNQFFGDMYNSSVESYHQQEMMAAKRWEQASMQQQQAQLGYFNEQYSPMELENFLSMNGFH